MSSSLKLHGPPGTGKSARLLHLLEQEIKELHIEPKRIAFLTFTREARQVAVQRCGLPEAELPFLRTIHSICYRQLGINRDAIVTPAMLKNLGLQLGLELSGQQFDAWAVEAEWRPPTEQDQLLQLAHYQAHRGLCLQDALQFAPVGISSRHYDWFLKAYEGWKAREHLVDYTDLLLKYLKIGSSLDVEVAFVDEAQDLSWLQWQVVKKLTANAERLYVAGDSDQAIFTWAGASAGYFDGLRCTQEEVLVQSYRLPHKVFLVARRVVQRIQRRTAKHYKPREAEGQVTPVGQLSADLLAHDGTTFILCRHHFRAAALRNQLVALGLPFTGLDAPLAEPQVAQTLQAWARASQGMALTEAQVRALGLSASVNWLRPEFYPSGRASYEPLEVLTKIPALAEYVQGLRRLPYLDYVAAVIESSSWQEALQPRARLLTIHQAKGHEADTVILDLELATKTFDQLLTNPDDEHRVFYVGVTRARERLYTLLPVGSKIYEL